MTTEQKIELFKKWRNKPWVAITEITGIKYTKFQIFRLWWYCKWVDATWMFRGREFR
jgi:hypothetical protein